MALQSRVTECISAESLEETWEVVGSGGFGHVYKARHKMWKINVAIKLLRDGLGSLNEANLMDLASCDFVLRVYGLFEGCRPRQVFPQEGIVMEFMPRGSVDKLQKDLCGPPPWPLAFRLAHEVALGMNFLHSKALVHCDLKPSNVLLNEDFHAKLSDFGLSKVSTSAKSSIELTGQDGGSYKYMPPEAFSLSYQPVRSFDIYSYGILLWSLLTGKEPYARASYDHVALRIPKGDRPPLDEVDLSRSEGLKELVELMKRCWDGDPTKRPSFQDSITDTERVFSNHGRRIPDAVREVWTRLESSGVSPMTTGVDQSSSHDTVDQSPPVNPQQQNLVRRISDEDKAKFVDDNMPELIQRVSEVMAIVEQLGAMVHRETYSVIYNKPTSQQQMRVLYQVTFRSGGVKVKAAFYDILTYDFPDLVTSLGGER